MQQKNDIVKSVVVLTVICLVVSGLLAVVNHFTAPVSAKNAADRAIAARREIIPDADSFEEVDTSGLDASIADAYCGLDASGSILGYIFTAKQNGFGGTITVMCGISADGTIIACRTMDVSSETSTLGGKTTNPEYTAQYTGQDSSLSGVQAISGATITSNAYKKCVESAFTAFKAITEAGK